jgi:hypothetical protein
MVGKLAAASRGRFTSEQSRESTEDAWQLALPLFMAGVGANYIDAALAAHHFAVFTDLLDAGSDFHRTNPVRFRESDLV